MRHGVLFDNGIIRKHSSEWGLMLTPFDPPSANPKTDYVIIEGGNGSLDLTEAYGKIYYNDLDFNIVFSCLDKVKYESTLDEIKSFLHGRRLKVFMYYDEDYYYDARIDVNKYASSNKLNKITLHLKANPFKLKRNKTVSIFNVSTSKFVNLENNRMETVPKFKCDTDFTVIHNGNSYVVNGEVMIPDIELKEGDNIIELRGNGTIEISYQEGKL